MRMGVIMSVAPCKLCVMTMPEAFWEGGPFWAPFAFLPCRMGLWLSTDWPLCLFWLAKVIGFSIFLCSLWPYAWFSTVGLCCPGLTHQYTKWQTYAYTYYKDIQYIPKTHHICSHSCTKKISNHKDKLCLQDHTCGRFSF